MKPVLTILFLIFISCNNSKRNAKEIPPVMYVVNGYKSYSLNAGGYIKEFKWRVVSGKSTIFSPDSVATYVQVKSESKIELKGTDNFGMTGTGTIILKP